MLIGESVFDDVADCFADKTLQNVPPGKIIIHMVLCPAVGRHTIQAGLNIIFVFSEYE